MIERSIVNEIIDEERDYQDSKWATDGNPHVHTPTEWLVFIQDYLTEAIHIASRNGEPECNKAIMANVRKITAMGVAAIEQNGCPRREIL